jgi:hypothetical protein
VRATLVFDVGSNLVDFVSDDRAQAHHVGALTYPRWSTPIHDRSEFRGRRVPTRGEAIWIGLSTQSSSMDGLACAASDSTRLPDTSRPSALAAVLAMVAAALLIAAFVIHSRFEEKSVDEIINRR